MSGPGQLHVGGADLQGWINLDAKAVTRLTSDLHFPLRRLKRLFIDQYLETLRIDRALYLLKKARRALTQEGILRIRTPDLEQIFRESFEPQSPDDRGAFLSCLAVNAMFQKEGRQFLYNRAMLSGALRHAGFAEVEFPPVDAVDARERLFIAEARGIGGKVPIPRELFEDLLPAESVPRHLRLVRAITRRVCG